MAPSGVEMTPLQIVYKTTNPIEQLNPYVRALPSHKCTTACSSSVLICNGKTCNVSTLLFMVIGIEREGSLPQVDRALETLYS